MKALVGGIFTKVRTYSDSIRGQFPFWNAASQFGALC
jgi:hypothetical protein